MWGQLSPLPSRDGKMAITPIICNIGSVDIHSLVPNKDEVEQVFTEKLDTLCDSARLGFTQYRSAGGYTLPVFHGMNHRIWGLTAIITHQLLGILAPTHYRHKLKFILPLLKVRR
ncbi:PREDICTED: nucleoside diphosphate-linked moiety X motif 8, mitochondrial-like isoform X2 [Priapulus caudatus]|nr:PREDICTED: nucleoside diphosphate-linked moiety X motif 8, mitochondrial-like isoform X2 [Priapulus caudatus]